MITHLGLDYDYFEMGIQMQNNETNESPENLTLPNQEDIEKPILNPIVPASGSAGIIFEQNSEVLPVARHKSLMPESPEEYIKSISRQGEMWSMLFLKYLINLNYFNLILPFLLYVGER